MWKSKLSVMAVEDFMLGEVFTKAVLILSVALASNAVVSTPAAGQVKGAVGVCISWGASPDHVEDAVVVVPSGNPVLDAAVPGSIRQLNWPRPTNPAGVNVWVGIWMSVDGAPLPTGAKVTCEKADDLFARSQRPTRTT